MGTLENGKTGPERELSGERVIAATRRPDGSLRKQIRIRAGYTPQDEVAIYQPKGAQLRKGTDNVPPGYDPTSATKPKTKAAKKNEKRKEKKQQSATAVASDATGAEKSNVSTSQEFPVSDGASTLTQHLSTLKVSASSECRQESQPEEGGSAKIELEKRIRALRKKIRTTESKHISSTGSAISAEQADKMAKLEAWQQELEGLEALLASA